MSYHRSPDDLPDAGAAEPAAPAPAPAPAPQIPDVAPVRPIAEVVDAAAASEARRRRKQLIIGLCVAVDVIIVAIVFAMVVG